MKIPPLLCRLPVLATLLVPFLPVPAAGGLTFYDIDFEQSNNVPGQTIPVGSDADRVGHIYFGDIPVAAFPGTGSNAALFNTAGNGSSYYYDAFELPTQTNYPIHHLSLNLLAQNLIGTSNHFSILFDTPGVQTVRFMADGYVWINQRFPVARFFENENIHLEIIADTVANSWDVRMNGVGIYSGPYLSDDGWVRSVRMSLGIVASNQIPDDSTNVFVDDILLVVPEPSAACLLGLGMCGIWKRRRQGSMTVVAS